MSKRIFSSEQGSEVIAASRHLRSEPAVRLQPQWLSLDIVGVSPPNPPPETPIVVFFTVINGTRSPLNAHAANGAFTVDIVNLAPGATFDGELRQWTPGPRDEQRVSVSLRQGLLLPGVEEFSDDLLTATFDLNPPPMASRVRPG